ncbi:hypothetical protein Tco_0465925 [Tanacetum coccineum]
MVWNVDSMIREKDVNTSMIKRDIFESKMFSHDFIPDERLYDRPGGSAIGIMGSKRFIKVGGRGEAACLRISDSQILELLLYNVKEAILLHNALSRQTKDAGYDRFLYDASEVSYLFR